ncbi:HSI2-like 1 [Arabidopsis thaliana]|uniref:B3 domain-containing transcription repressor VAL2 n=1 Tax=Arabidopsis thaliana TaxID=3702 RepID=VAL2_ARATH|nr:HSI2-like 1 [Arabidopsis thaliana]Q5CCK4.1 RecName: Full=B3 domain-containing transcription repressor VAL2; AltName: Full=Protein HIGH-LEVEL EXPRESSION OF SUGAR-INDUCIBLE-LIKE 1; AltName: Full=Protein VP1/ABI3-LIKE 2 [Arabidopsis thaliana]AEE85993.1 HSI2-like 1 [Arabidopsis thaliana]BAD90971.1 transcription factor B3-EAR motif family [Arabidopsis thaliana]|eukprot:NP_194929.2 HSI2-like 1 [Arabidopsis thaliana]
MESIKVCMNALCGAASTSGEWKKGWPMRSGDLASLCDKCGCAYEQSIFCEVFHAKESGWRECNSCDKRLHCGCIASRFMMELLENGGVTCISCAKKSGLISMNVSHESNGKDFPSFASAEHVGSVLERTNLKHLLHFQRIDPTHSSLQMKQEESLLPSSLDALRHKTERKELSAQPNLSISLGPTLMTSPFHDAAVDDRSKTNSIFQLAPRSRQLLPKPANSAPIAAGMEPSGSLVSQIHVARPPPEGRGKTQLLPRYWPRITDQELLQLSGQYPHLSNSKIIPLFEKVLSASDAGRIGRLVLPKACAEAYFPPISLPEGLPLKIQDIKGKEWVFQFRFWPNNNSRMYVLEGVTPCIQSMQLQAGDTVTFSRTEPEGKLVMGYRKATNSTATQMFKGSSEPNLNMFSNSLNPGCGDINWSKLEKSEDMAKDNLFLQSSLTSARKRVRNIGTKSKRLLIDSVDVLELKITWEEAQELLRPPQSTKPSIFTLENQDFEEYDEPPVFGKRTLFVSRQTGEQEQWVQCDACGKWRQLPVDILLPPKWSCSDNLLDPGRSSCSAPDELSPREQDTLVRQSKEFKRRRLASSNEKLNQSQDASALNSLGNAGITTTGEQGEITVAATTKHPRHRAGCSCIVCSQPPSGKGKHKPSCTCTVCEAVKRRFRTLMLRKRNKGEAGQASQQAQSQSECRDETEVESIPAVELAAGENIDLNSDPGASRVSMMRLLQAAAFPLEAYLKQKAISNTAGEQQSSDMVSTEHGSSSAAQETEKDTTNGAHDPVN